MLIMTSKTINNGKINWQIPSWRINIGRDRKFKPYIYISSHNFKKGGGKLVDLGSTIFLFIQNEFFAILLFCEVIWVKHNPKYDFY